MTVRVQPAPEEATIIALTTNNPRFAAPGGLHAVSLDHDVVYGSDGGIWRSGDEPAACLSSAIGLDQISRA